MIEAAVALGVRSSSKTSLSQMKPLRWQYKAIYFTTTLLPEWPCFAQQHRQQQQQQQQNTPAMRVPRTSVFAGASAGACRSISANSLDRWGDVTPDQAVRMVCRHHCTSTSTSNGYHKEWHCGVWQTAAVSFKYKWNWAGCLGLCGQKLEPQP